MLQKKTGNACLPLKYKPVLNLLLILAIIIFAACKRPAELQDVQEQQQGLSLQDDKAPANEQVLQYEQAPQEEPVQPYIPIEADYEPASPSFLPVIRIDTIDNTAINQKTEWIPASYVIYDGYETVLHEGTAGIRGRGNSTWNMPKKPYNLNLDAAEGLFGMPSHRRWALLANYADKSLLRTDIVFGKLSFIFDNLAWTPGSQFADLYLNGSYRGVYQLTENIRVDANRVNITPVISSSDEYGGYLLEVCERMEDEFNFRSTQGVPFNCSSPDSGLDALIDGTSITIFEKIQTFVLEAEDVLYGDNFTDPLDGWRKYLDTDTFVDWYLINEITKNVESIWFSSVYMYYDPAKEKLCMGPLWDYDISSGNADYSDGDKPLGFYTRYAPWISRLFQDPEFIASVKLRWNEKYSELPEVFGYIDEMASLLNAAQYHNFNKWLILDKYVWPNAFVSGSYNEELAYLKSWLDTRITWLNAEINKL